MPGKTTIQNQPREEIRELRADEIELVSGGILPIILVSLGLALIAKDCSDHYKK